jgi:hypothetical protein
MPQMGYGISRCRVPELAARQGRQGCAKGRRHRQDELAHDRINPCHPSHLRRYGVRPGCGQQLTTLVHRASRQKWANKRLGTVLEDPSLTLRRRGVSGPDCRHLLLECRFEMLQRAGRGLARESGEVMHHVHLVAVAEAMGDLGP